jgi:hypothetical protein
VEVQFHTFLTFTPQPLYPQGKIPCYPLDKRLGALQSWSGHSGEEKNSQPLSGLEPLIIQLVAQHCTTELADDEKKEEEE